jgi:two-component system clock-associated histidine kinase SasA
LISADRVNGQVQFSVADTGPGIPLGDQLRIFDEFVRLEETPGGSGLGLAIARAVVVAHGGEMWVDSGPGPGSVFSFTLPVHADGEPANGGATP